MRPDMLFWKTDQLPQLWFYYPWNGYQWRRSWNQWSITNQKELGDRPKNDVIFTTIKRMLASFKNHDYEHHRKAPALLDLDCVSWPSKYLLSARYYALWYGGFKICVRQDTHSRWAECWRGRLSGQEIYLGENEQPLPPRIWRCLPSSQAGSRGSAIVRFLPRLCCTPPNNMLPDFVLRPACNDF